MSTGNTNEKKRKTMAESDRVIQAREKLRQAEAELAAAQKEEKDKKELALAEMMRLAIEQFPSPLEAVRRGYHNTVVDESVTFNPNFEDQLGARSQNSPDIQLFEMEIRTEDGGVFHYKYAVTSFNRQPRAVLYCVPTSVHGPVVVHTLSPLSTGRVVAPSHCDHLLLPLDGDVSHSVALGFRQSHSADFAHYGQELWAAFQHFLHKRALYLLDVKFMAENIIKKKEITDAADFDVLAKQLARNRELVNTYAK